MTHSSKSNRVLPLLLLLMMPFSSFAYMGPGAGITAIGCLIALAAGIWYTFKGFLWFPLKRFYKKHFSNKDVADEGEVVIQPLSQEKVNDTK